MLFLTYFHDDMQSMSPSLSNVTHEYPSLLTKIYQPIMSLFTDFTLGTPCYYLKSLIFNLHFIFAIQLANLVGLTAQKLKCQSKFILKLI